MVDRDAAQYPEPGGSWQPDELQETRTGSAQTGWRWKSTDHNSVRAKQNCGNVGSVLTGLNAGLFA